MTGQGSSGYPEPPAVGSEAATLLGSLERQRLNFSRGLDGAQLPEPWAGVDPSVRSEWREAVARSRAAVRRALARGGPEGTYGVDGGHVDLLREAVDGRVAEDPPGPAVPFALG